MAIIEIGTVSILAIIIILQLLFGLIQRNRTSLLSPIIFISVLFLYYTVVGPLYLLNYGGDNYKHVLSFTRDYFLPAWQGSLLAYSFVLIGFYFPVLRNIKYAVYPIKSKYLSVAGLILIVLSLLMFIVSDPAVTIKLIDPSARSEVSLYDPTQVSTFKNYLINAILVVIPGLNLLYLSTVNSKWYSIRKLFLYFCLLLAVQIFLSLGFRNRIVLTFGSLFISHHLFLKRKVNLVLFSVVFSVMLVAMGLIASLRTYGKGLDYSRLDNLDYSKVVHLSFLESNAFPPTGAVIKTVPSYVDYAYFEPLIQIITLSIPRKFYPSKKPGRHLHKAKRNVPGANGKFYPMALLYFGEWHIAFGYFGIILSSFLLGLSTKHLWRWILKNLNSPFAITLYAVLYVNIYLFFSRGYFALFFLGLVFSCLPALVVYKLNKSHFV